MKSVRLTLSLLASALTLTVATASHVGASTTVPQCIVSLSPTATSTLYAIGAGANVQAVDQDSNYPAAAAVLAKKDKINALEPSAEGLLGLCPTSLSHPSPKPDLVIISYNPSDLAQKLEQAGVRVLEQDAATSVAGAEAQIVALGRVTGHLTQAQQVAHTMQTAITTAVKSVPAHTASAVKVFYEISANPYYSATSATFVGQLLHQMGVTNIADAQDAPSDGGYPQLSKEYLVSANPSLIFLAGDATVASVAARPGFAGLTAVKQHHVYYLDANVASQWGPRIVQLVQQMAADVTASLRK